MSNIFTLPDKDFLNQAHDIMPDYMRPNRQPYVVVVPGWLSDDECDDIVDLGNNLEPYSFHSCDATTREFTRPLPSALESIVGLSGTINDMYWGVKIDDSPAAWLQTYEADQFYDIHVDGAPGQSRKLTAVALLSKPGSYRGGDLVMHDIPGPRVSIGTVRGTVALFMPWQRHEVTPVTSGLRQSVNVGFYGPPFK